MPTINLLPWRERIRDERKAQFIRVWGGCVVMACLFMVMVHAGVAYQIKAQRLVNATLQSEINKLDIKIAAVKNIKSERTNMLSRMDVIQQLQQSRPLTVKVFDAITRLMPDGVHLTVLKREESRILMKGKAESNTRVSDLMRNLEQSPFFADPKLTEIKSDKTEEVYQSIFELYCMQIEVRELNHG